MSENTALPAAPEPAPVPPPARSGAPLPIDFSTALDERTKAFTVAAALLGLFLAALDQTIVATAMPRIALEFNGFELYTWVTTAYILASTAMVPIYGKLSDIYGRKAILLTGIGLFLAASVACGAATSMQMLVAMRAVQGLGAAALTSTAFAVVADLYEPKKRAKVQGFFGAVFGLSSVIGPALGGALTEHVSWRSVFFVNVPIGAVAVAFILMKMPALRSGLSASIDWLGAALIVTGSVPLMLALSLDKNAHPWTSPGILGLAAVGLASFALFVWVETKVKDPILPMRLFRNPAFSSSALVSFLFGGVFFGAIIFIPLFMSIVVGVSDTASGTTLMPLSISMVLMAAVTGQLAGRFGRIKPFALGALVIVAVAFWLLSTLDVESTRLSVSLRMIVLGLGIGPNLPLLTMAVQGAVGRRDIGIATSARQFFQQLGGAFGAALLGAVLSTTQASEMKAIRDTMPPDVQAQLDRMQTSGRAFGAGEAGGAGGQGSLARQHIEASFAKAAADLEAALVRGDEAARARLKADPRTPAPLRELLEAPPQAQAQAFGAARQGLEQAKAAALEGAKKGGELIHRAVRESFAAAITRLFLWSLGLALLTLLAALMLRDQKLGGTPAGGPPARVEL